jgi:hypothetical protein
MRNIEVFWINTEVFIQFVVQTWLVEFHLKYPSKNPILWVEASVKATRKDILIQKSDSTAHNLSVRSLFIPTDLTVVKLVAPVSWASSLSLHICEMRIALTVESFSVRS